MTHLMDTLKNKFNNSKYVEFSENSKDEPEITVKNKAKQEGKCQSQEQIQAISDENLLILANTIVEVWRLKQAIIQESRFIQDSRSIKRLQNQLTRFSKHYFPIMTQLGLQIIDFTNKEYEPGLPVDPINLSDFQSDEEHLKIEFMMEPVIKRTNSADIIHRGIVVLGGLK